MSTRNPATDQNQRPSVEDRRGTRRRRGWRGIALIAAASAAVGLTACGGESDEESASVTTTPTVSAEHPESVAAAERAVYNRVGNLLASARAEYPDDGFPSTDGPAVCRPISDFQLDCTQRIRDDESDFKGTTRWRATVDPKTGKPVLEEHGGKPISEQLGINQSCLEDGVAC